VRDLDPAVERVILRCLEQEPRRRPSSALSVAMALPGGDPIAAALAAGETPSPEMVAASGEKEGFSPRTAWLSLAGIVLSIAVVLLPPVSRISLLGKAPVEIPPEVLAFRAQDMLKEFGYAEKPVSTAYAFDCCDGPNERFVNQHEPAQRDAMLATHQPPIIRFWYRQSQGQLVPQDPGPVSYDSPPNSEPTMVRVALDATGRLVALEARPAATELQPAEPRPPTEPRPQGSGPWPELFKSAGLDVARFSPAVPEHDPPMAFDARAAWVGTYAEDRKEQIRVEAAAWQGRPVYVDVSGEWRKTGESTEYRPAVLLAVGLFVFVFLVAGAAFVAWRNLHSGRGDRKGAARIAGAAFLSSFCGGLLAMKHVAGPEEVGLLVLQTSETLFLAVLLWLAYLAVEPYARRYWPDSLISWNRLLSGRLRDSLTASHILAGFLLISGGIVVITMASVVMSASPIEPPGWRSLNGTASFAASLLRSGAGALAVAIGFLLLVVLLRLLLRRVWIADCVAALAFTASFAVGLDFSNPYRFALTAILSLLLFLALVWMLRRLGFVSVLAFGFANLVWNAMPQGTSASWYGGYNLVGAGLLIAVAAWAVWVVLSAQHRPASESAG
jgi:hypothetical protein